MAFPSANVILLRDALDIVRQAASSVKSGAVNLKAISLGTTGASSIINFALMLAEQKALLAQYAGTPGLGAYAQSQLNSQVDIVAAYTTMVAQIDATVAWIIANFPTAGGFIQERQFTADGRTTERTFTSDSLAGLRTQLDALIATID